MKKSFLALFAAFALQLSSLSFGIGLSGVLNQPNPMWGFINNQSHYSGYIYTRGLYYNEDGNPVLVEYGEDGKEIRELGPVDEYDDQNPYYRAKIISTFEYYEFFQQLENFKDNFKAQYPQADDLIVLTVEDYQDRLEELKVVGPDQVDWSGDRESHEVDSDTRSVVVLPEAMLLEVDTQYLLQQFPFDFTNLGYSPNLQNTTTLIVDSEGIVIESTQNRFGLRSIFFEDPSKDIDDLDRYDPLPFYSRLNISEEEYSTLLNPVQGIQITAFGMQGMGTSDDEGRFEMMLMGPPCPNFSYSYDITLEGKLPYRNFNPEIPGDNYYYIQRPVPFFCNGMGTYNYIPQGAGPQGADFPIDINILTGSISIPGVELSAEDDEIQLKYDFKQFDVNELPQGQDPPPRFIEKVASHYDFDQDGDPDTSVCGELDDEGVFIPVDQGMSCEGKDIQGVYLSSSEKMPYTCPELTEEGESNHADPQCQPHFTRFIDFEETGEDIGFVLKMNEKHIADTDIFVVRQSTQQLIAMRQGLKDAEEIYDNKANDITVVKDEVKADYRMFIRGAENYARWFEAKNADREEYGFDDWQQNYNISPEFQSYRESDHIKAGETIEIWAINRVTGYIGSSEVIIGEEQLADGYLDTLVEDIELLPPNIKIWAERKYEIEQGITKDEKAIYIVGNEGGAEEDDIYVSVYVEWLDQDGTPLPQALKDYGFTGRIAYLSNTNKLTDYSRNGFSRFQIEPGSQSELMLLKGAKSTEHIYVQVNALPYNEFEDFALSGESRDEVDNRRKDIDFDEAEHNYYRPEKFVPFKTPQHDEVLSAYFNQVYLEEKRRRILAEEDLDDLYKPKPTYHWFYRPEYQFSIFDFEVTEFNREYIDGNPEPYDTESEDILLSESPTITSLDSALEFVFDLAASDKDPLLGFDGEKHLVLELGGEEYELTIGSNETLEIHNYEQISAIEPEDYMTASIYLNNDAGNIIWQYAFEYLDIEPLIGSFAVSPEETIYISADEPYFDWKARLLGFSNRDPSKKEPAILNWTVKGQGSVEERRQVNEGNGLFINRVTMPTTKGSRGSIEIELEGSDSTIVYTPTIEVTSGKPDSIAYSTTGSVGVMSPTTKDIRIIVRDQHGNLVEDGTIVSVFTTGSLQLQNPAYETVDGVVNFSVLGGDFNGDASVVVTADEVVAEIPVTVHPVNVVIDAPSQFQVGDSQNIGVTVTDYEGSPIEGIDINLSTDSGYLRNNIVTTDAQGRAETRVTLPMSERQGKLNALVGLSSFSEHVYEVIDSSGQLGNIKADNLAFVGDQTTPGIAEFVRFDDTPIEMPYSIGESFQVVGQPGEDIELNLGNPHARNRAPLAFFQMGEVFENVLTEPVSGSTMYFENPLVQNDHRMGLGTSVQLNALSDQPSKAFFNDLSHFETATQLAFSLEVKFEDFRSVGQALFDSDPSNPNANNNNATVFSLGQQGLQLVTLPTGQVQLSIQTSTGFESVISDDPLQLSTWHRVAGEIEGGLLRLWVDDQQYTAAISESPQYSWVTYTSDLDQANSALAHDLVVGSEMQGLLSSLKFYDAASSPLIHFAANDSETISVQIPGSGEATVAVESQGLMAQHGSPMEIQKVALTANAGYQEISLVSLDTYKTFSNYYATFLADDRPPLNVAAIEANSASGESAFPSLASININVGYDWKPVKTAEAISIGGFAWGLVNIFLPIESVGIVMQQVAYAFTDPSQFDPASFVIAMVDTLATLPALRPLRPYTQGLQRMFVRVNAINPKFTRHFSGAVGRVFSRLMRGDFDTALNVVLFMVVAYDIYDDPQTREALNLIWESVESPDDLFAWIDWISLPDGTWEGEETPPVEVFAAVNSAQWTLPFKTAFANGGAKAARVNSHVIGTSLHRAADIIVEGKDIRWTPKALKSIVEEVKKDSGAAMRVYKHSAEIVSFGALSAARGGVRVVRDFIKNGTGRYSAAHALAIVAYLEWELVCGKTLDEKVLSEDTNWKDYKAPGEEGYISQAGYDEILAALKCNEMGLEGSVNRKQVHNLYIEAFSIPKSASTPKQDAEKERPLDKDDVPNEKRKLRYGGPHGAMFHLAQIARFQLHYRGTGDHKIKAIEAGRHVWFVKKSDFIGRAKTKFERDDEFNKLFANSIYRRLDLITEGDDTNKEIWHEFKSYAALGETGNDRYKLQRRERREIVPWKLGKGNNLPEAEALHKQFAVDRTVMNHEFARLPANENKIYKKVEVESVNWWWQKFKVKLKGGKVSRSPLLGSTSNFVGIAEHLNAPIAGAEKPSNSEDYELYRANMGTKDYRSQIMMADLKATLVGIADLGFEIANDNLDELPDD